MKARNIILFLLFCCNIVYGSNNQSSESPDTTKAVTFLDGKKVWAKDILEGLENKTVKGYKGFHDIRDVLLNVGEKYRYNEVTFWVTIKKEEKENEQE